MKTIAAELWSLQVVQSTMDFVHGFHEEILEVYIPEHNIAFNICQGNMSAFVVERAGRYSSDDTNAKKIKDITLSEKFVNDLKTYVNLRTSLQKDVEEFFKQYENSNKED